jgi:hypothetical protein
METFTPFGCRYEGDACSIKLRFKEDKFKESGLSEHGRYRYTSKGYIIFEITVSTKSDEYKQVFEKINSAR